MNEARKTAALLVLGTSLLLSLGCPLGAQQLTLTPSLANPREWVQGVLRNTNDVSIFYVRDCEVRTLRHSGEFYHVSVGYASPRTVLPQDCDQTLELPPGATHSFFFRAPNDPGSYTVITADLERAAARLDVVAPVVGAQDVCFYPSGMWLPQTAHEVDFRFPFHTTWEFANTGTTAHVFGVSSSIRLFAPGSPTPVATTSLAGVTIPAGRVTEVTLPLVGLPPGPYTVEANFVDASTGSVTTRSGIQPRGARVDLHMHGGREVAPNEQIGMALAVTGFPTTGQDPYYFLLVGFQAGTTPLPGGLLCPLGFSDPLVQASVNGLAGLLVNHMGQVSNSNATGVPFFAGGVDGLAMRGPPFPGVSGLVLRVAVLAVDSTFTTWGTSQPEEVELL